ncbi:2-oxo acid dehydrogenase subunit E2 [Curtobacterium sp. MCBD17_034]|uniref:dihydrolipoamide acetyltransferase family protein n=1 Tax=unclassified Curtobacterium TaxID=257496 RepID=UPI000DAA3E2F|nr:MULTISPECIES: dihydrolipoamide acetyltransferase family protein [unclassified Curtobacterium]PZF62368.1 2-oxo acid dehydrogenase subunit E2 [Curtobacterium sp. MCBD17_034]PZM39925.1 2-oxo acid dehydrogenase subunit E2 [Curtobacterium sp. MCBD17_031]
MPVAEFPLPDVGEGLTEAEIVQWRVALGDEVSVDQVLVEIETAKSLVELPSPFAGTVTRLLVDEGATVEVGVPIIQVDCPVEVASGEVGSGESGPAGARSGAGATDSASDGTAAGAAGPDRSGGTTAVLDAPTVTMTPQIADTAMPLGTDEASGAVLVGYGSAAGAPSRRRPGARRAAAVAVEAGRATARADQEAAHEAAAARRPASVPAASALPVVAKPPIRKLAKDLGVDLTAVVATGLAGEVTRDDVIRSATQATVFRNLETPEWGDVREERIPVKGVRKAIATAMTSSAFTAPHVSLFVDVDASRAMEFVARLKTSPTFAGVKVSPLLIMAKAVIWAVRRNPTVNSTWTDREIIVHHFVNLGIAAATPRGLIVPNVKDAQDMSLFELAQALERLTLTARDGKTTPEDMTAGTVTITNIGVFGMDTGTPILNPGEVGIVAMGTIKPKPWVVDGEVRSRMVTTIGASFDHRVVDGDVASRFVQDVASVMEEPALLLD